MNTGGTWFKFALVAFLAVVAGAALAQDPDASRLTGTGLNRAATNAFPAHIAKPVIPVGKSKAAEATSAPEIAKLRGSHQVAGARSSSFTGRHSAPPDRSRKAASQSG